MSRTLLILIIAASHLQACVAAVTFDWAYVGNAGNVNNFGDPQPQGPFGAVSYNYAISKTEVTNAQYTVFLNAVDPTGANGLALYNLSMTPSIGGIALQAGNGDGSKFVAQAGREQHPVNYVSFFDAMRFTNWLHNGQGAGDTESGAYTIGSGIDEVRSTSAKYWIPSENEWYKAAYHDASAGTAGVYFEFATGSDRVPLSDQPGDNPAAVNYFNDDGLANGFNDGYAVSGSRGLSSNTIPFTNVGAYTGAASPYGTFDQNGNVVEWNEAVITSSFRGLRGGSWFDSSTINRSFTNPASEDFAIGFRVATVPEPTALTLAAMLFSGLGFVRRRV